MRNWIGFPERERKRKVLVEALSIKRAVIGVVALVWLCPAGASAVPNYAAEYLLIGTGPDDTAVAAKASNWELGRISANSPWFDTENLPGNALAVGTGTGGNGDTAITDSDGIFDFSNMDVFGNRGVDCAGSAGDCAESHSNTNYNGSSMSNSNGIHGGVDLSGLNAQLASVAADIPTLPRSYTLTFNDGKWDTDQTITVTAGLTVIDINTNDNDLLLEESNLIFDGPVGSFIIVRVSDDANFTVTKSNIIVGDSGIGLNSVLFFSDKDDNNQHFNFNNTILNGVAFWDLSEEGEIHLSNAMGCTQLVGSKIDMNDVELNGCATAVPEPNTALLIGLGLVGLTAARSFLLSA